VRELLKAVILAGGFGTRLRPLSCTRPKILFPVANKPLLQWTFERLAHNNIQDVVMAVFYQTEVYIKHHRVPRNGVHVTYSHDPLRKPLGTGGSIKRAEKQIGHDVPFLVLNGDVFADINYGELLKAHNRKKAVATITLRKIKNPSRYGVADLAKDNRIVRFIEKPPPGTAPTTKLINAGAYVFSPKIFECIAEGRAVSIEHEIFPKLAREGTLYGHVFDGLWMDIGKPEDYLDVTRKILDSISDETKSKFRNVELNRPVSIGKKVSIGEKSTIGPYTVLGQGVALGKNVHIQNSIVFPVTTISDFSSINSAIIGEGVFIGKKTKIEKGCIIGDHARIRDGVSLAEGISVCPANEVSQSVLTPHHV
jgi:mannose-1-phosphate guanylyltransferase